MYLLSDFFGHEMPTLFLRFNHDRYTDNRDLLYLSLFSETS